MCFYSFLVLILQKHDNNKSQINSVQNVNKLYQIDPGNEFCEVMILQPTDYN